MSPDIAERLSLALPNSMAQASSNRRLHQPGPHEQALMSISEIRYI
ncbi:Unknown protein sequence [Pseudomonas syringae pv. cilantro]|uniref:Uncharacterized protein n=2 Tax=Pseudomonas syringae group TaxID=136849 RepID=A0A0N0GEX5_PSESX|nr:Unknown protein sequence [Pseudomonas syringae pv. cilantro]KPW75864.1 hypothetical protein ALO76_102583 [Pseudomonas syringae pv. coriandricola]RMN11317.1 hypothetical protein ALQ65_102414 [Pseudomonas syringae pv. coriandricola]